MLCAILVLRTTGARCAGRSSAPSAGACAGPARYFAAISWGAEWVGAGVTATCYAGRASALGPRACAGSARNPAAISSGGKQHIYAGPSLWRLCLQQQQQRRPHSLRAHTAGKQLA